MSKKKVLIIEADDDVREVRRHELEALGVPIDIHEAKNCNEGIAAMRGCWRYDAVLVSRERIKGQVEDVIGEAQESTDARVIVTTTAYFKFEEVSRYLKDLGVHRVLLEPFRRDVLAEALN